MAQPNAADLWKLNQRLLTRVLHAATPELERVGLDTKEFFVLEEIATSPYPAELAKQLMLPKASVTIYLRNLVAAGLVRREIDDADLRRHRLAVTDEGRAVLEQAVAALESEFTDMMRRIPLSDQVELERILVRLLDAPPQGD
jgi:DNA-binding MarR family transcriptional regulator